VPLVVDAGLNESEGSMPADRERRGIEIAIGPHPHRPDWYVLRVTYAQDMVQEARIAAALMALLDPETRGLQAEVGVAAHPSAYPVAGQPASPDAGE
jgi:hypothetical protein